MDLGCARRSCDSDYADRMVASEGEYGHAPSAPAWRQGLKGVNRLLNKNGLPAWVDSGTIPPETTDAQAVEAYPADCRFQAVIRRNVDVGNHAVALGQQPADPGGRGIYNLAFRFLARFVFDYSATIETYLKSRAKKLGEQPELEN